MKLFKTAKPVQFNITQANKGNGKGFNSAFKLERTRFPKPTPQDMLTRMIIRKHTKITDLQVGDVLRGTRQEFHDLFGSHVDDVNKYCQSAVQLNPNASYIDISVKHHLINYNEQTSIITDTNTVDENVTDIMYKGVAIKVSISVGGVPFDSVEDAKRGIDLATKMLKVV